MTTLLATPSRLSPGDVIVKHPETEASGRWVVDCEATYNHLTKRMRIAVTDEHGTADTLEVAPAHKLTIAGPDGPSQTAAQILGETS